MNHCTICSGQDNYKMYHTLKILYLLTLSAAISGRAIHTPDDYDYPRYAYNYGIDDLYTRDADPVNGPYSLLDSGNIRELGYTGDGDFSGFNAIVQKLSASLTTSPLFGPLPLPLPPVNPLINPLNYGFGTAPSVIGPRKVKVTGHSIPWDPKTRSYGGWVPLRGPVRKVPLARLVTRKYVNGHLYKVKSRPIPLTGKKIIIKRRPVSD